MFNGINRQIEFSSQFHEKIAKYSVEKFVKIQQRGTSISRKNIVKNILLKKS